MVRNVSKTFPGTRALIDVDFGIRAGEIHALVGQNGSGKSTLVKTLAGYYYADSGEAWIDGESLDLSTIGAARHDRLRFVHQDLGLVLELSAAENLALFHGFHRGRFGRVRWHEQAKTTRRVLERFAVDIDIDAPLSAATPVERTVVAIGSRAPGLGRGPRSPRHGRADRRAPAEGGLTPVRHHPRRPGGGDQRALHLASPRRDLRDRRSRQRDPRRPHGHDSDRGLDRPRTNSPP